MFGDKDEREIVANTRVFPYSAICYLETTFPDGTVMRSTGFMIYKDLVLTSAHSVYFHIYGGGAKSVKVVPAKNGKTDEPWGHAMVTSIRLDAKWVDSMDPSEDWSLLRLDSNIGDKVGWIGIAFSYDYSYFANGESVTLTGYPLATERGYRQYTMRAPVVQANALHLIYEVDTEKGQSGAPVMDDPGYAIAINSKEQEIEQGTYNQGVNITRDRFNLFVSEMY